jgi:chromosome segregation and condensation protein ScpB
MITKDEIQELLRMFSSEDDVTSLSQALSQVLSQVCPKLDVSHYPDATAILIALCKEPQSLKELMEKTKEKNRGRIKNNVLQHLCESGLVEPTIKDVPNSPKQKYALTDNGREKLQTIS